MLSEKIRKLRKQMGVSQEELAEQLCVSRQAVSKWELGTAVPTADKLVDIADLFGVSLDFLMREDTGKSQDRQFTDEPKRRSARRKITGWCLIGTALFAFLLIAVLYAVKCLAGVSGSFIIRLDGVGIIVVSAVLCAAIGAALLISLKK